MSDPGVQPRRSARAVCARLALPLLIWLLLAPLCLLPGFQLLDYRLFDLLSTLAPPAPAATPVVLVAIDEPSFAELGLQWPWPREKHAELIRHLAAAGAAVIALDIVFAEPSRAAADQALADAIGQRSQVILAADLVAAETPQVSQLIRVEPLPALLAAGAEPGVSAVTLDRDGVLRKLPADQDGFALTALRAWQQTNNLPLTTAPDGPRLLQYFDPSRPYPAVSYYQALAPDQFLPPGMLRNRIVLVGRAIKSAADPAARQSDTFATPVTLTTGELMPGIGVHATILDNLRLGLTVRPAPGLLQPLGLALVLAIATLLFRNWQPWSGAVKAGLALLVLLGGSFALLRFAHLWLSPPLYLAGVLLSYGSEGGRAFLRERRQRQRIKQAFGRYLSPVLVEQLAADPAQLSLGGESRVMTIMFCDIRGFTTLSEQFKTEPARLVQLMNRYFTAMTAIILHWQGTVDKYIGDCIMAFWNAPLSDPDHARHACSAALEMVDRLRALNDELARESIAAGTDPISIEIGIGINTGLCVVGNIGGEQRFDYSVLGDAVNLASRLEGQCKTYGLGIVIGPETAAAAQDLPVIELDLLAVKGKQVAERIFALLRPAEVPAAPDFPDFVRQHAGLLAAYRRQDWAAAKSALAGCRAVAPGLSGLHDLYARRIIEYEKHPPPANWTGANVARTK